MNIECKLKRQGGTKAEVGGTEYHFAPQPDGAHVASVEVAEHIERFLSIPEAYCLHRQGVAITQPDQPLAASYSVNINNDGQVGGMSLATASSVETKVYDDGVKVTGQPPFPVLSPVEQDNLYGSASHPLSFDINGTTYSLGDVVARTHLASGLTSAQWNELDDGQRADLIDAQLDKLADPVDAADAPQGDNGVTEQAADTIEAAAADYFAKFAKKPHHKWNAETIRAKLAE